MAKDIITVAWFRQDLRISDNPALAHAASRGRVIPLYVLDETAPPAGRPIGSASRWWLHHSLEALSSAVGDLILLRGDPLELVPRIVRETRASAIAWNRCYEPYAVVRDTRLKSMLVADGIEVASFNAALLHEPWEITTGDGQPYKVYSAFWRSCAKAPVPTPGGTPTLKLADPAFKGERLADWRLLPARPNWAKAFAPIWQPGERGAQKRLRDFLASALHGYARLRDRPDTAHVSRLSPHLHFGEISPCQVWAATMLQAEAEPQLTRDAEKFLSEIGWREFAYHLLFHFPTLPERNWRPAFDAYPWTANTTHLAAWREGRTGYPIVDAGMRELWATGYMHNRVRMIVASFLVKHLRIDWRRGEAWFWDTLVDADLANNAASWQWVAGSGADAAPYFRIFNPVTQGRKFDPDGVYVRRWCPEIARLPDAVLHAPFEADAATLSAAGVALGRTYPAPIVDHAAARRAALDGYAAVKDASA